MCRPPKSRSPASCYQGQLTGWTVPARRQIAGVLFCGEIAGEKARPLRIDDKSPAGISRRGILYAFGYSFSAFCRKESITYPSTTSVLTLAHPGTSASSSTIRGWCLYSRRRTFDPAEGFSRRETCLQFTARISGGRVCVPSAGADGNVESTFSIEKIEIIMRTAQALRKRPVLYIISGITFAEKEEERRG